MDLVRPGSNESRGITVPIYPTSNERDVEFIVNDSEAVILAFGSSQIWNNIKSIIKNIMGVELFICINDDPISEENNNYSLSSFLQKFNGNTSDKCFSSFDDLATIIYTSGTTGNPKGALLKHQHLIFVANSITESLKLDDRDLNLLILPLAHGYPRVSGPIISIFTGMCLVYSESMARLGQNLQEIRPTMMAVVPRVLETVYERIKTNIEKSGSLTKLIFNWSLKIGKTALPWTLKRKKLPVLLNLKFKLATLLVFKKLQNRLGGNLRFLVCAGAPLPPEIAEFFLSVGITVLEFYGLTETLGGTLSLPGDLKIGRVGKAMHGFEIKISESGEIMIKGNSMVEYYHNEKATNEIIQGDWVLTGDTGELDQDEHLKITGRIKNIIITSGGKKIPPENVENVMSKIPFASQVMAYGDGQSHISLLITLNQELALNAASEKGITCDNKELYSSKPFRNLVYEKIKELNRELPQHERVTEFFILERQFMSEKHEVTPTLKLRRKQIMENFAGVIKNQ